MNRMIISKRIAGTTYRVVHRLVRFLSVFFVLLACVFVFLRVYGVPDPILQMLVERANAAGIPVHVESLSLTLRGWRATGVSYYSQHPDDLSPLFHAQEVLFARKQELEGQTDRGWKLDFEAVGIEVVPSVEWGVSIPEGSRWRHVDEVSLTIGIFPDRVEFSNAEMAWMGIDFRVDGVLVKPVKQKSTGRYRRTEKPVKPVQETVLPVYVSADQFQMLEDRLRQLEIEGDASVEVDFSVDMRDYAQSVVELKLQADDVMIRQVDFDEVRIEGSYTYPQLKLDRMAVERNAQSLVIGADYDFSSSMVEGRVDNSITSKKLLLLTPQPVLDLLVKAQLQIEELPKFSLQAGPCNASDILNSLSGSFSVRDVTYCGLLIESARGRLERQNNLLTIDDIHARVEGQEHRSAAFNSCMKGGAVSGRVFWDANRETFGVEAEGSIDPNLVIDPLAIVPIATNVIDRFYFPNELPQLSLKLGACYTNWKTFYIDINGVGHDVGFHEALLSTANISAFYTNAILRLDPIAVMDGVDFMKGTASLDFRQDTVTFDAFGSLNPALVEEAVYPDFGLFSTHLLTSGDTQIKAKGALDWSTMQATRFRAEVEAERLDIPGIAGFDGCSALVLGDGPLITVTNTAYGIYGGSGTGTFSVTLDPGTDEVPYAGDLTFERLDYKKLLQYVGKKCGERTRGKLSGTTVFSADLKKHFLDSANGTGKIRVEDGELADIPLFSGFSKLMRRVAPGFRFFSITRFSMDFDLTDGRIHTENALFSGDVFHAEAKGSYAKESGYDARVHVNMLSDKGLSKVIRVITSPITKLFEFQLTGSMDNPQWRLRNFNPVTGESQSTESAAEE